MSCEQPGIMAAPHWHAQAEVNFVFRGGLEYDMHGHRVRLEAGAVALFWGGLPHRVVDTQEDTYFHAIHLPLFHFFRLNLAPDLQHRLMRGATLLATEPQRDDAPAFLRRARYLNSSDSRLVQHGIDELLLRLERIGLEPHRVIEPAEPNPGALMEQASFQGIRRICGYIAENFREDIDSVDIAVSADIHPKYAMSVFKRSTGMSLGEYVSLMRVSYAQALLMREDASILQVAMDSGFGSISAFNKCFRKKSGMTPSEFKREHRSTPPQGQA
ncbi:MAG TPA: helix-turn-helix domain-containing protein [Rubellimicrobium sp.]|nr:helix-turn-helix domain-containing protein [Rubellimicrobium sp.]